MSQYSKFFLQYRAIPGIYKITNTVSGEFYIGATSNIGRRWCQHLGSSDLRIQKDMQELGPDKFKFEILEVTATDLASREKHWIGKLNPSYNATSGGEGTLTESSRLRMRASQKILHASPEYRAKQQKSMKRKNYRLPDGTIKALRLQDVGKYLKKGVKLEVCEK